MSAEKRKRILELRRKRAAKLQEARHLVDTVDQEERAMTQEEDQRYEAIMSEVENLGNDIQRREQLLEQEAAMAGAGDTGADSRDLRPDPENRDGEGMIGLSPREIRQYNLRRAILAQANRDWRGAEFERECSEAVARQAGIEPEGFYLPFDVAAGRSQRMFIPGHGWQYRDLNVGTGTAGGNLVATDLLASSFIDLLRNALALQRAGATVLSGLVGDIAIPKQSGAATTYWVAEGNAPTESQQTIAQVPATPHTIGAFTDFTRKLMLQSSIDVETMVRTDLATVLALGIDYAGLHGDSGSDANQPDGVETYADVTSVVGGTDGAAPDWADIVGLETAVANDNALMGRTGYITNTKVRGKLKTTDKASGAAQFVFEQDGTMNGYGATISNQVRSNRSKGAGTNLSTIFFGNWADFVLCLWSGVDILVDPYTGGTSGTMRVVALQDVDWLSRHDESFSAMLDAVTT